MYNFLRLIILHKKPLRFELSYQISIGSAKRNLNEICNLDNL